MNSALNDKIRMLREMKSWSQEQMAERVDMSKNGYAKVERGETRLTVEALDKIAQAFDMDMTELININDKGLVYLFSENHNGTHYGNYYQGNESVLAENEKLQLSLKHKDELLDQKDMLIETLQRENALLRSQLDN